MDRAQVPAKPVRPKVLLNLCLGLLGGIVTGLIVGFWAESVDDTLSAPRELESAVSLPVLSSVPQHPLQNPSGSDKAGVQAPILIQQPRSQAAEAFRRLRAALLLSSPDRQPRVIAVVSALCLLEGKTTVTVNLGIAIAERGETVLTIDADLRRSAMHDQFGIANSTTAEHVS